MNPYVLYGMAASLYTGKVRAYLRKQGIAFEERIAGDPRFREEVVPAVGRWIIPVLQTPQGEWIQDGADIIDHFDSRAAPEFSVRPADPVLRVIAHIFEWFGGEGLLRPAMHYRWNFDRDNLDFLRSDFGISLSPPGSQKPVRDEVFERSSARMRRATLGFGVSPATFELVEASYLQFLTLFEAHLEHHPYLLGGQPCLGDYGLFAPLYAHLGRDPHPAMLMKQKAPRVWHWVERMNSAEPGCGGYPPRARKTPAPQDLPQTLLDLLRFVAEDYLPEARAYVAFTNEWLRNHPGIAEGSNGLAKPGDRSIGMMTFNWRGQPVSVVVMPYRLYLLQRIQDAAAAATAPQKKVLAGLLGATGLTDLLELQTLRRVERRNHLEVWGPVAAATD